MYLLLLLLWLIFHGRVTPEIVLFGLGLTALVGVAIHTLWGYGPRQELRVYRKLPLLAACFAVLLWSVIRANLTMMGIILHPGKRVAPVLIRVPVDLKTRIARFLLANSITLTPGTITVLSEPEGLTVHCLNRNLLDDLENGAMIRLLRRLEA